MMVKTMVALAAATLTVAGCGGGNPGTEASNVAASTSSATEQAPQAATFTGTLEVMTEPHGAPKVRLPQKNTTGARTNPLVKQVKGDWVELYLPIRPNGSTGWVPASAVKLQTRAYVIKVSRKDRAILIYRAGVLVASGPAAVGKPGSETPAGHFYVTEHVHPSDPSGAYGSVALGLSAHSDTYKTFGKGDGQIGIHGTNEPASVGKAVSHGCVRVSEKLTVTLDKIPTGTPVDII